MKDISYERLEKITSKINKSIAARDIDLLNKWYVFVEKETKPGIFKELFAKECAYLVKAKDVDFFEFLIKKTSHEFTNENWKKILINVLEYQNYRAYDAIEAHLGDKLYSLQYFKENIIYKFYAYRFNHGFDKLLEKEDYEHIKGYFGEVHLNGVQDILMTEKIYQKLSIKDKRDLLEKNLTNCLSRNAQTDVEYFFHKLHQEFLIEETTQEKLLMHSMLSINGVSYLSNYDKQKFITKEMEKKKDIPLRDYIEGDLSINNAGIKYVELLKKYLFNKNLNEGLEIKPINKKVKI